MPRAKLEKIVDGVERFTTYKFAELVKKKIDVKYSESHTRRLLRSLGFVVKKTPRISDHVPPPKKELEIWQKDTESGVDALEKDGFTLVMVDESHQNSNIFGSGAVYVRGNAEPISMPLGNQRQTIYGGITLDGQTCYMAANKAASEEEQKRFKTATARLLGGLVALRYVIMELDEASCLVGGWNGYGWLPVGGRETIPISWSKKSVRLMGVLGNG